MAVVVVSRVIETSSVGVETGTLPDAEDDQFG
jgi:hypothetical protein